MQTAYAWGEGRGGVHELLIALLACLVIAVFPEVSYLRLSLCSPLERTLNMSQHSGVVDLLIDSHLILSTRKFAECKFNRPDNC